MRRIVSIFIICTLLIFPQMAFSANTVLDQEKLLKQTVKDYFDIKYKILSTHSNDWNLINFIDQGILAKKDILNEADVLDAIVMYRKSQINDLRFDKYLYNIKYDNIKITENTAWLMFDESYELYFNCAKTVKNSATIEHAMMLRFLNNKWYIVKDDYSDPDGVKNILNKIFLENNVSIEKAKQMLLEQSDFSMKSKISRLQELLKVGVNKDTLIFYKGKPVVYSAGAAGRLDSNGAVVPILEKNKILLPLKYVCEKSGAHVSVNGNVSKIKLAKTSTDIEIKQGDSKIKVGKKMIKLETPVKSVKGLLMLQADVLAEILGKRLFVDKSGLVVLSSEKFNIPGNKVLTDKLIAYYDTLFTKSDFPRIDGSTATYPLSMEIGKELLGLDDTSVKGFITHKTTHNAYVNLIDNKADIIFVTQPSPEEVKLAAKKGVELQVVPICKEGFVFLVNKENKVSSVTTEQIQQIYQSKIKNWKEVGGSDDEIIPYQREANSGSQTIMENTVMKGLKLAEPPKEVLIYGMGELIDRVADYSNAKNALGYSVYYYATKMYQNRAISLLAIDGVMPGKVSIKDGTYPFTIGYYAVLRKSEPSDSSARKLLKWLLGNDGQTIVDKAGFVEISTAVSK